MPRKKTSASSRWRTLFSCPCTELFPITCPSITTPRIPSHTNTYPPCRLSSCYEVFSREPLVVATTKSIQVEGSGCPSRNQVSVVHKAEQPYPISLLAGNSHGMIEARGHTSA